MNVSRMRRWSGALMPLLAPLVAISLWTALVFAGDPPPPSAPADTVPVVPVGPALPALTSITIGDSSACDSCLPHVCSALPVRVRISGVFPTPCWTYLRTEVLPTAGVANSPFGPPIVRVLVRDECAADSNGCLQVLHPFTGGTTLAGFPPGRYELPVQLAVQSCADSTALLRIQNYLAGFRVDSCQTPPYDCVWAQLLPAGVPADTLTHCALTLPPASSGSLVFDAVVAGAPVAGLQGEIHLGAPLTVSGIESAIAGPGIHVQWRSLGRDAAWTLFADHGAPLGGVGPHDLLRVTVRVDSSLAADSLAGPIPQVVFVTGNVTSAADSNGNHVDVCPVESFAILAARVCIVPGEGCDVNRDGQVDVADLVRMARCWYRPASCPDSAGVQPDCTGDGAFHLDDVMCCARRALGEPANRRPEPAHLLTVGFEPPVDVGGGIVETPLVIRGATEMDGALLRLVYPADRYELAADPAGSDAGGGWLPLSEPGSGEVVLGLLRLDTAASGEIRVPLRLRLLPGRTPGGQVQIRESSLIAPDGGTLELDLSGVSADLAADPAAGSGRVELSRPMPNPSSGQTRFDVTLPLAASDVDLAIYDVAGRRVATLWHGPLAAGRRAFTWQPANASGVYFARLVVGGQVRASRLTLQGSR